MENKNSKNNNSKKVIMMIVLLIIIILSLITSCSCSSSLWGKVGELFTNRGEVKIDPDEDGYEVIKNKDLKFDINDSEISSSDNKYKISFGYKNINPKNLTCKTSDASIATCYVEDGYVVVIPKGSGTVTVIVSGEDNGKTYEATTDINVKEPKRYIKLSSKNGTIDLSKGNVIRVPFTLVGLDGNVSVSTSNEKIATATISGNTLIINAKKEGNVKVTLRVLYNDKEYSEVYTLRVKDTGSSKPDDKPDKPVVPSKTDSYLEDLMISTGNMNPSFNKNIYDYEIKVSNDTESIKFNTVASLGSNITFIVNGKEVSDLSNVILDSDKTIVKVIVKNGDSKHEYTFNVIKDSKQDEQLKTSFIESISISAGTLDKVFDKNDFSYTITVPYDQDIISLNPVYSNGSSYSVSIDSGGNSLNNINLVNKVTNVVVNVTNGDSKHTYQFKIVKQDSPKYLESLFVSAGTMDKTFVKDVYNYTVTLGKYERMVSLIPVSTDDATMIFKIGDKEVSKEELEDIVLNNGEEKVVTIIVKDSVHGDKEYKVTLVREKLSSNDIYLDTYTNSYDLVLSDESNTRGLIFNTNAFVGDVNVDRIAGGVRISSVSDPSIYLDVISNNENIVKLDYKGEVNGPSSLGFLLTGVSSGNANVLAKLYVNGNLIHNLDVVIKVTQKYTFTLSANGGEFNDLERELKFFVDKGDIIDLNSMVIMSSTKEVKVDLSIYDIPYKISADNECLVHIFLGYSLTSSGSEVINTNIIIDNNLVVYALYKDETKPKDDKYTLYVVDIPLFHNEEYFNKYNKDKIIYPGAYGSYIIDITNESKYDITINKLLLNEDSVCISEGKCLNMGYIIKHAEGPYYYMGKYVDGKKDIYELLHNNTTSISNMRGNTSKIIDMEANNETITIPAGATKAVSVFWQWVDIDNSVDTAIGNYVSKLPDGSLDNKYRLSIGFTYKTLDSCKID